MRPESELNEILVRKSQLFQWRRCPRLYDNVWIKKLPTVEGVEQRFGSIFHYNAQVFFDNVKEQQLMMNHTQQDALTYFMSFQTEHPVVGKWMRNFFAFEALRWQNIRQHSSQPFKWWMPVAHELELFAKERGMEMHVDRIDRLSDGNLINIEYKTDKWWNLSGLRSELGFYNIGINASGRFAEPCTHYGCYNPQLDRSFSEAMTPRLAHRINRLVLQFRRAIVLGEFPPRPSRYCRYCSFAQRCLDAGVFNEEFIA